MKHYRSYMDSQKVSEELHRSLLELKRPARRRAGWQRWGALAACGALIVGLGVWGLGGQGDVVPPTLSSSGQFAPNYIPEPGEKDVVGPEDSVRPGPVAAATVQPSQPSLNEYNFLADSGMDGDKMMFPFVPAIGYPSLSRGEELSVSPDYAYAFGSFSVGLTEEQIKLILWGSQENFDQAHDVHFKVRPGNVPWLLQWDGYILSGRADYSPEGQLNQTTIWGTGEGADFTLCMAPGHMPVTDMVRTGAEVTDVRGVEVKSWQTSYDYDGDGAFETLYVCTFMAHDVGIHFTVQVDDGVSGETGATLCSLLANWASYADCPVTLEHLMVNEDIPAWRSEEYKTYAPLLQEAEFVPYLPGEEPVGYGEFQGYLTYQERNCNTVHAIWMTGYESVCVAVFLPEGEQEPVETIDVSRPETYDTRLYPIPWCDSVPEEYIRYFLSPPVFRAQDMSLEIIEARMVPHDTGGESCQFKVLHENDVLVSYSCDGLSAEQVWAMVEQTTSH